VDGPAHLKSHAILSGLATDSMTVRLPASLVGNQAGHSGVTWSTVKPPFPSRAQMDPKPQQAGGYLP
jgi:hypothetical protein